MNEPSAIQVGDTEIKINVQDGVLRSIGAVTVNGKALRNPEAGFLPWFDSYGGEVFDRFEFLGIDGSDDEVRLHLRAVSDSNFPFRERRDASGDLCFRNLSFDAPPVTGQLDVIFKPVSTTIDGRDFSGFSYAFEYENPDCPIHRLLDRTSWELGGSLEDVTLVCRNWLTPPRMKIGRETVYSTVGMDKWAKLLPGNMWARWSLLPGFDLQYGKEGILVGWYDRVSLVRTAIETNAGEDAIRFNDFHWFEQSGKVMTNPKTILHCPDVLDDVDALNLWTAVHDRDRDMARRQFDIPEEEPPRLIMSENAWFDFHFDHTYDPTLELAAEFGMDQIFVDVCWEQGESLREYLNGEIPPERREGSILEKYKQRNMCCVFDFKVAEEHGGEAALKRLCQRAAEKDIKVISWMAAHVHPHSVIVDGHQPAQGADGSDLPTSDKFSHGSFGAIAATESGRHPSTGYANACWTLNLNSPVFDYWRECILGVCERTGLSGFLWDSFSNLGWWQVDYSDGTMRTQFEKMAELYADMTKRNLYVTPEAIVAFSSYSCCGLHGGDIYQDDMLGYSYDSNISLHNTEYDDKALITGKAPVDMLFRCLAHRRVPSMALPRIPRDQWNEDAADAIKTLFAMYKAARGTMKKRTVLKNDAGVVWSGTNGDRLLWSFKAQDWEDGPAVDILTGEEAPAGNVAPWRVYRV